MYPARVSCVRRGADGPTLLPEADRERLARLLAEDAVAAGLPVEHVVLSQPQPDGLDVVVFVLADDPQHAHSVAREVIGLAVADDGCLRRWRLADRARQPGDEP